MIIKSLTGEVIHWQFYNYSLIVLHIYEQVDKQLIFTKKDFKP